MTEEEHVQKASILARFGFRRHVMDETHRATIQELNREHDERIERNYAEQRAALREAGFED